MNKKMIYASYGIEYKNGKIFAPVFGWIPEILLNGNSKLGDGVYTFSLLPGADVFTLVINGVEMSTKATCPCNCKGCYAMRGFYNMPSAKKSAFIKTVLAREYPEFFKNAIIAQLQACKAELCRLHESGDFFSSDYIELWKEIVKACPDTAFWGYTKNKEAEEAFDNIDNCNIVKSVIRGFGFNFGKCGYILKVYRALTAMGKSVYICRCGIDKEQHCTNCKGCSKNEFVLFIEHSTGYKAEEDTLFPELKAIIENQPKI